MGLSFAYNYICKKAADFDFILLLDQDSKFEMIMDMCEEIRNYKEINEIAIFAPRIQYDHIEKENHNLKSVEYKNWVISSGSCLNLEAYKNTEGFDEYLFIDRVDYDYCISVRNKGYKIVQFNNIILKQKLGDTKKFMGKTFSEHSAIRYYYMSRNRWYVNRKYNNLLKATALSLGTSLRQIFLIAIYESDKRKKINNFNRGFLDYLKER